MGASFSQDVTAALTKKQKSSLKKAPDTTHLLRDDVHLMDWDSDDLEETLSSISSQGNSPYSSSPHTPASPTDTQSKANNRRALKAIHARNYRDRLNKRMEADPDFSERVKNKRNIRNRKLHAKRKALKESNPALFEAQSQKNKEERKEAQKRIEAYIAQHPEKVKIYRPTIK